MFIKLKNTHTINFSGKSPHSFHTGAVSDGPELTSTMHLVALKENCSNSFPLNDIFSSSPQVSTYELDKTYKLN